MRLGMASAISVNSLADYLADVKYEDKKLGLGGTAVNEILVGLINHRHHVTVFTLNSTTHQMTRLFGPNLKIIL